MDEWTLISCNIVMLLLNLFQLQSHNRGYFVIVDDWLVWMKFDSRDCMCVITHWTHGRSAKPDTGAVTSTVRKYIVSWCTRARTPPNIYNIRTSSSISCCYVLLSTLLLWMRPDSHLNGWSNNIGTTVRIRETFPSKSMYSTSLFVIVSNTIIQFLREINSFYKTVHVR